MGNLWHKGEEGNQRWEGRGGAETDKSSGETTDEVENKGSTRVFGRASSGVSQTRARAIQGGGGKRECAACLAG